MGDEYDPSRSVSVLTLDLDAGDPNAEVAQAGDLHFDFLMVGKGVVSEFLRLAHAACVVASS